MLVRTVTTFLTLPRERRADWPGLASRAAEHNNLCKRALEALGYEVQTTRVVTSPFAEWAGEGGEGGDDEAFLEAVGHVRGLVPREHSLSIGALLPPHEDDGAPAEDDERRTRRLQRRHRLVTSLLPAAIRAHGVSASVHVPVDPNGVPDYPTALAAAEAVRTISETTEGGEGNFCFAAASHGREGGLEGCPFFPSGMTRGTGDAATLFCTVGLQFADALVEALRGVAAANAAAAGEGADCTVVPSPAERGPAWGRAAEAIQKALTPHLSSIARAVIDVGRESGVAFRGVDASAAPAPSALPLTEAYKLLGVREFGAAGTLEASAFLTRVLKSLKADADGFGPVPLVGYTGLMLPPTEDLGLAEAAAKGSYGVLDLLQYSAVCGIGLDTVPIPGDTPAGRIAALICDVVSLSARLAKPLSVRLFPVPGLAAGDMTAFSNPHLCNTRVFQVP